MARVSREQSARNREEIEQASARLFRERGLNGVSVAELMADAGLTHGGFYGHFASKDELAAVAVGRAFKETDAKWQQRVAGAATPEAALTAIVDGYLSAVHRDKPGAGCVIPALSTDVAREAPDKPVRQAYADGLERLVDTLAKLHGSKQAPDRAGALRSLAMLTGAVTLARATSDGPLSEEILAAVRGAAPPAKKRR